MGKNRNTVKPEKNTTIKFHENALKQFSNLWGKIGILV